MKKKLHWICLILNLLAVLGETIACVAKGYPELLRTILIVSAEIRVRAFLSLLKHLRLFSLLASALGITGCVLLIGYPSYVPYIALPLFILALIMDFVSLFWKSSKDGTA